MPPEKPKRRTKSKKLEGKHEIILDSISSKDPKLLKRLTVNNDKRSETNKTQAVIKLLEKLTKARKEVREWKATALYNKARALQQESRAIMAEMDNITERLEAAKFNLTTDERFELRNYYSSSVRLCAILQDVERGRNKGPLLNTFREMCQSGHEYIDSMIRKKENTRK